MKKIELEQRFFQFPLFLLRDLLKDKRKCLNDILCYGVYRYSNDFKMIDEYFLKQVIYYYYSGRKNIPDSVLRKLESYKNGYSWMDLDENIIFSRDGFLNKEYLENVGQDPLDELKEIFENEKKLRRDLWEVIKGIKVLDFFKITGNYKSVYKRGCEIAELIPEKSVMLMINKDKLFEYRDEEKSEYELLKFAVTLSMKSIIGKRRYYPAKKEDVFLRAIGFKNKEEFLPYKKDFKEYFETYLDSSKEAKKRQGVRYHTDKILDEIQKENWNLYRYTRNGFRGTFIAYKDKIKPEDLVEIVIKIMNSKKEDKIKSRLKTAEKELETDLPY